MRESILLKLLTVACFMILTQFVFSAELIVDNFNYTNGALASNGGWTSFILQTGSEKSAAIDEVAIVENPLEYTGYLSSNVGKSIQLDGLNKDVYRLFPHIDGVTSNKTSGGLDIATGGRVATGDIYAAMLINMERAFYGAGDPEDTKGDCFFAYGSNTWGIGAAGRIYTRKLGNGYQIGVTRAGNAKTVWDPTERSLGTTYLVVLKYSIIPSPNSEKNDRVYLSINPVLGASEPTWIANDATDTNGELPSIVGSIQFLQKINTSANNPQTVTAKLKVSGLRVATTWAEVGALSTLNGFDAGHTPDFKLSTINGVLKISGVNAGQNLEVYNSLGQCIVSTTTIIGDNNININAKGLLVVKVGVKVNKVVM